MASYSYEEEQVMSLFIVDQEKCNSCGICVVECAERIIEIQDADQLPTPIDGADDICLNCGHCVTVCPCEALTLQTMTPEQCPPVQKGWHLGPEQVRHLMRSRRSIRTFKDRAVDRELLTKLIDVARFAPSGLNRQPVSWLVISDRDRIRWLAELSMDWMYSIQKGIPQSSFRSIIDQTVDTWEAGIDTICRDAPHIIIAHASEGQQRNCTIALTYLELAAPSFGLGACWAGWLDKAANNWQPLQQYLELPEGHTSCGAMMIGYPKYRYRRIPLRDEAQITWR